MERVGVSVEETVIANRFTDESKSHLDNINTFSYILKYVQKFRTAT